jgi:hypothetical protein
MENSKVFNVAFAGGSCGITMVRVGEKLTELCQAEGIQLNISYVDLWVSDYLMPSTDLVVEMFPYYKRLNIPVINGKPFLNPQEEEGYYPILIQEIKSMVFAGD